MKGSLKKFTNPKFIILMVFFVLLAILSPISLTGNNILISKNTSNAADSTKVIEIINRDIPVKQWVTESALPEFLQSGEWVKTGAEKLIDPSLIKNGVLQSPSSGDGWIISLAKAIAGYIIKSILAVIYLVLWVVYSILYGLTLLTEKVLEMVLDPLFTSKDGYLGGFTTKTFVRSAAQLLANLCNMLYIFVLIYIAIKTMFGSSSTRNLLIKLVIAALLTNFGLVLAGVVIDFSQVAMYTVWDGIKGSSDNFAPGTKILDKLQNAFQVGRSVSQISSLFDESIKFLTASIEYALTEIIKIAGLIIMSLALVITLVSIAVILMIRIVALWILLILTPVAFLFSILPQTEKYWNDWLETITKYALTGPILIFFLWLALKLAGTVTSESKIKKIDNNAFNNGDIRYLIFEFVAKNITILFEMMVIIITVWAGIIIANKFGIKGAKSVDWLTKSTFGLGKGLANYIPWYSGRAASWVSFGFGKIASSRSQKLSSRAGLAKSKGDLRSAEAFEKQATRWTNADKYVKKQKDRVVKGFSVMNPLIVKKQFATWWSKHVREHMEQSESSVDEFGRDFVRFITRGKTAEGEKAETMTEAKINDTEQEFKEKLRNYVQTKTTIAAENKQISLEKAWNQNNSIDPLNKKIVGLDNQIAEKNDTLDTLKHNLLNTNASESIKNSIRKNIKNTEQEKKHLEKEKIDTEEEIKKINKPIEEREEKNKLLENKRGLLEQDLSDLGARIAELSTKDEQEKENIERETQNLINTPSTSPLLQKLLQGNNFISSLNGALGYTGNQTILEKAKKLSRENTIDLMTGHIWQKDKMEKAVKESLKELEDKRYTMEQLEDMAKSGYGDAIMRTAIFRRLAASPRNFGNLLAKTLKDYNNDEKKALGFLKQRYSEDELIKAFSAADIEARKSQNLFSIGWLKHDSAIGKLRFARGNERSVNLANFTKGMTPENINKINPQSFKDDEAIKQMAQNFDWVKLARNPRFIDGMSRNTRMLFKEKQVKFEHRMDTNDKEAFRRILNV